VVARNPSPKVIVEEESTIAGEWAEEKSTAVEEHDQRSRLREFADAVAAQNRANTPVLPAKSQDFAEKSGNSTMDELTVDEPRRQQNLNSVEITGEALANARLTILGGNDKGRELDLRAGQTFTIGRGIDNDLVLTDIAASRKHFDLRYDGEYWCVKDRGSGNGTLINGTIQDNETRLYNADRIEIGNTLFLFDHPTCPERPKSSPWTDDEESTIGRHSNDIGNGRQLPPPPMELSAAPYSSASSAPRQAPRAVQPSPVPLPAPPTPPPSRPVTRPPPVRSRPTKPPPGAERPADIVPLQPLHFAEPAKPRTPSPYIAPQPSALPTTMPGAPPPAMRPAQFGQPQALAQPQILQPPAAIGQAPIQPYNYGQPQPGFSPNNSSQQPAVDAYGGRRTNRTFPPAITESRSSERMRAQQSSNPPMYNSASHRADPTALVPRQSLANGTAHGSGMSKRNKRIVAGVGLGLLTAVVTAAVLGGGSAEKSGTVAPKAGAIGSNGSANNLQAKALTPDAMLPESPDPNDTAEKERIAAAERNSMINRGTETPVGDKTKAAADKAAADKAAADKAAADKAAADKIVADKAAADKAAADKAAADKAAADKIATDKAAADKIAADKAAADKERREKERLAALKQKNPTPDPKPDPKPPASDGNAKKKANDLYQAKKFKEAASVAKNSGNKELMGLAKSYDGLARTYNTGMTGAPTAAFDALQSAISYDKRLGGQYVDELNAQLGKVAPKAVAKYLGDANWRGAAAAARKATDLGFGDNSMVKSARSKLETQAGVLFREAQSASPDEAQKNYQTILAIVDESSKWYGKAQAALNN